MDEMVDNKRVIEISFPTGAYSNTFKHNLLYSIIRNKWIKGNAHAGLNWAVDYRVLEGEYLLFSMHGYYDSRGVIFSIEKIKIEPGGYDVIDTLLHVDVNYSEFKKQVKNDTNAPEILKDFIDALPSGYHSVGSIPNTDKVYPENAVNNLVKYVKDYIYNTAEY